MSLRPIHRWKLDSDGNPKLDRHGQRIPHPKAGQAKKPSEYTRENSPKKPLENQEKDEAQASEEESGSVAIRKPAYETITTITGVSRFTKA